MTVRNLWRWTLYHKHFEIMTDFDGYSLLWMANEDDDDGGDPSFLSTPPAQLNYHPPPPVHWRLTKSSPFLYQCPRKSLGLAIMNHSGGITSSTSIGNRSLKCNLYWQARHIAIWKRSSPSSAQDKSTCVVWNWMRRYFSDVHLHFFIIFKLPKNIIFDTPKHIPNYTRGREEEARHIALTSQRVYNIFL